MAYNAIVRRSRKQWGFIGVASIHDVIGLEERQKAEEAEGDGTGSVSVGAKTGWTFRRTENLRLWAA